MKAQLCLTCGSSLPQSDGEFPVRCVALLDAQQRTQSKNMHYFFTCQISPKIHANWKFLIIFIFIHFSGAKHKNNSIFFFEIQLVFIICRRIHSTAFFSPSTPSHCHPVSCNFIPLKPHWLFLFLNVNYLVFFCILMTVENMLRRRCPRGQRCKLIRNHFFSYRSAAQGVPKALTTGEDSTPPSNRNKKVARNVTHAPGGSIAKPAPLVSSSSVHTLFAAEFFSNISKGYDILLHTFQYLKVQVR